MDEASIQWRRAKWFEYVRRRFDLMSFGDLADWIATEAGSVRRNEADREQALVDLENSVKNGEFGPADVKRCILWLPKPPPGSDIPLGQFCLRLNYHQIVGMRGKLAAPSLISDLYASRALCLRWSEARQIRLPPWLKHPETPAGEPVAATIESTAADTAQALATDQPPDPSTPLPEQGTLSQPALIVEGPPQHRPPTVKPAVDEPVAAPIEGAAVETSAVQQPVIQGAAQPNKGAEKLPPFDEKTAMVLFVAQKKSGVWQREPTEDVSRAFLKKHYSGVPNDPHRALRRRVWPEMRRGRKRKSAAAD
jgi:hypothetical protein